MLLRRHLIWGAPLAVLGAGIGGGAWLLSQPARATGIGGPFTLVDGDGRMVTNRDFEGRWMLIYFGYTHCPDACPTALADMAGALDLLPPAQRRAVALLFITIDPERDTPAVMKDYVANFGAPIVALSGSPEQVAAAAKAYRVYFAKHPTPEGYDMDHSSVIYVMNPYGDFVANFSHATPAAEIADKLRPMLGSS